MSPCTGGFNLEVRISNDLRGFWYAPLLALVENEEGLKMAMIEWLQRNVSRFLYCRARYKDPSRLLVYPIDYM